MVSVHARSFCTFLLALIFTFSSFLPTADPQSPDRESVQYIRTDGCPDGVEYPVVTVIESRAALEAYYADNCNIYSLERRTNPASDSSIGFLDACDMYDDAYFAQHYLILILLEESSGSIRHRVTHLSDQDGVTVTIERQIPEDGTCDMAEWHILIGMPLRDAVPSLAEIDVTICDSEIF